MRILAVNTIDFLALACTKRFIRRKTPGAFQQSLSPKDFVAKHKFRNNPAAVVVTDR